MPSRNSRHQQTRADLRRLKKTRRVSVFHRLRRAFPERVTIVADGDSWFAYPPEWLPLGGKTNLIEHLASLVRGKANFMDMAANGDEAVDILSGKQKHALIKHLRWHEQARNRKPVDLLLFSGGGNDVVGENDFERFIYARWRPEWTRAEQAVNQARLKRKAKQVGLALLELLDIRDQYSPDTLVMTHTYDYPFPSLKGARFWGGLYSTASWMKPIWTQQGFQIGCSGTWFRFLWMPLPKRCWRCKETLGLHRGGYTRHLNPQESVGE